MREWLDGITWFRGSSVRIRGMGREVHVDPSGVSEESEADLILLTHPHFDNFSEADIARVRGPHTVVLAPATMKKQLLDADHLLRPGDMLHIDGFDILAVPAHNVGKKFHTRTTGGSATSSPWGRPPSTTRVTRTSSRPWRGSVATSLSSPVIATTP
jgi:L-ascorbate metabolism protein UlaG (beta-lactamase superfamily)